MSFEGNARQETAFVKAAIESAMVKWTAGSVRVSAENVGYRDQLVRATYRLEWSPGSRRWEGRVEHPGPASDRQPAPEDYDFVAVRTKDIWIFRYLSKSQSYAKVSHHPHEPVHDWMNAAPGDLWTRTAANGPSITETFSNLLNPDYRPPYPITITATRQDAILQIVSAGAHGRLQSDFDLGHRGMLCRKIDSEGQSVLATRWTMTPDKILVPEQIDWNWGIGLGGKRLESGFTTKFEYEDFDFTYRPSTARFSLASVPLTPGTMVLIRDEKTGRMSQYLHGAAKPEDFEEQLRRAAEEAAQSGFAAPAK